MPAQKRLDAHLRGLLPGSEGGIGGVCFLSRGALAVDGAAVADVACRGLEFVAAFAAAVVKDVAPRIGPACALEHAGGAEFAAGEVEGGGHVVVR